jgi:hypothetical protein
VAGRSEEEKDIRERELEGGSGPAMRGKGHLSRAVFAPKTKGVPLFSGGNTTQN